MDRCQGCLSLLPSREGKRGRKKIYCSESCKPSHWNRARDSKNSSKRRIDQGLQASRSSQHGMTDGEFLVFKAKGKCEACGATDPGHKYGFSIDHDHLCCPGPKGCKNCVRGLLCHGCNIALGAIKDDANRLLDLYAYLYRDQGMPVPQPQEALNG